MADLLLRLEQARKHRWRDLRFAADTSTRIEEAQPSAHVARRAVEGAGRRDRRKIGELRWARPAGRREPIADRAVGARRERGERQRARRHAERLEQALGEQALVCHLLGARRGGAGKRVHPVVVKEPLAQLGGRR